MKRFILIISLFLLFQGCKKEKKEEKVERPGTLVRVEKAKKEKVPLKIPLVGQVEGDYTVTIYPDTGISGIIERKRVDDGDIVKRGQALMEVNQQAVTGRVYNNFVVRAKISGVISDLAVENGDLVSSQTKLCKVIQMKQVKVVVEIPEKVIGKVKLNQDVKLTFQSYPGEKFNGIISHLSPAVDPNTLSLKAEVDIDNKDHRIKPGMFAKAEILLNEKEVLLVPLMAVIIEDNVRYVYVFDPKSSKVKRRVLQVGQTHGEMIEIEKGLREGEEILVEGNYQVTDQEKVRVLNNEKQKEAIEHENTRN